MAQEKIVIFHHDAQGVVRTWSEVGELVRCKDCCHASEWMTDDGMARWIRCSNLERDVTDEFYCASGKRVRRL